MQVVLIRAGRTQWDGDRRIQGNLAIPLSAEGIREVRQAFEDPSLRDVREVCTSFTLNALQTARILARRIARPLKRIDGLEEVDLGMWQGLLLSELRQRHPRAYAAWSATPLAVVPPRGETLEQAYQRLVETLESLFLQYGKDGSIAVVVPEMAHRLLLCYFKDVDTSTFWEQESALFRYDRFKV